MNQMKQIHVAKVVLNVGAAQDRDKVEKGFDLLKKLTGKQPVRTKSTGRMKTFGGQSGQTIGVKVTLRGEEATDFLKKAAQASENMTESNLDGKGNLSFGVDEYIDIPGVEYDGDIGMMGFEIVAKTERPGYRVRKRKHKPRNLGKDHKITDEEAKEFFRQQVGIDI